MERNIAQLRATKEMGQVPGSGNAVPLDMRTPAVPGSLPPIPSKGSPAHPPANVSPYAAGGDSAERILATIVTRRVGADTIGSAVDPSLAFARAVVNEEITETVAVQVLNDIAGEAPGLAMACLGHPKQFWKTAAVLAMFITDIAPDAAVYDAGVAAFEALADQVRKRASSPHLGPSNALGPTLLTVRAPCSHACRFYARTPPLPWISSATSVSRNS